MRAIAAALSGLFLAFTPVAADAEQFLIQSGIDSSPYSFLPSLPRGNRETAYVFTGDDEIGTSHNFRTFIRFDLPGGILGPNEEVTEAYAWVYYSFDFEGFGDSSAVPGFVNCHRILEPWEELTLTWVNQPATGPVFDTHPDVTGLSLIWCDVTELAQDWLTGAKPNHGIMLDNPTERLIGLYAFEADNQNPNLRPSLVIETGPSGLADVDSDGVENAVDNCRHAANALQQDTEGDGVGDACDLCTVIWDPEQKDLDQNGRGDRCDFEGADLTGDGRVGQRDANAFSDGLGSSEGDPNYDPLCDMDGDGFIGDVDWELWLPIYEEFFTGDSGQACGLIGIEPLLLAPLVWLRRRTRGRR